jgi:long-chain acyl-CoA synthetase
MRLRVEGREHLASLQGPVLFAPNHQSHADTPALMIALPARWRYRLAPVMWKEYFGPYFHPDGAGLGARLSSALLYYLACGLFNAFPIPQEEAGTRDSLRYLGEVLAGGDSVLVFPEGQRTEDGAMEWFRPGVGLIGARTGVPVVPVRIEGLDKVLHRKTWWPRRGPVRVAFGAPLRLQGDDYRALARRVEDAVRRL